MDDQIESTAGLSPDSVSLLENLLSGYKDRLSAQRPAPGVAQMVQYLCRSLSKQAMIEVDEGLAAHPAACELLQEVLTHLDELQRLPWAEVSERADGDELAAQVARAWFALASERVQAAPHAREYWIAQGLSAVYRRVVEGETEAQVAWAAFLAFGRQLTAALLQPRMAQARAGDRTDPAIDGELPSGVKLVVTLAEVTAEGLLRVAVSVRAADGKSSPALAGRSLSVSLAREGEAWPIAAGIVEQDNIQWEIPSLGAALGLPKGDLPAGYLRFAVDLAATPPTERTLLLAEIIGADRAVLVEIDLHGALHWQAEELSVRIAIRSPFRETYADYHLLLDILVSTDHWQRLGDWPVSDWDDTPRLVTVPCPGSADSFTLSSSFLRLSLQPYVDEDVHHA